MAVRKGGERGGGFSRSSTEGQDGERRRIPGGETPNTGAETAATQEAQRGNTSHASGEVWQTQVKNLCSGNKPNTLETSLKHRMTLLPPVPQLCHLTMLTTSQTLSIADSGNGNPGIIISSCILFSCLLARSAIYYLTPLRATSLPRTLPANQEEGNSAA
ncbi:hypothetical protein NDU88_006500 [Pleurodeles waltl]|uniref:Uncharacterized protein n=1 Tax=Pleurodeles waltl TaxID=8319 RepID=A0AAV7PII6_PLEWA|nr:hypothetical protein NDU88_006500 [Pleurodeles waltl]